MNGTKSSWGYPPSIRKNEAQFNRSFADPNSEISGASVVLQREAPPAVSDSGMWPRSLSDFLRSYLGRTVLLEYVLPNAGLVRRKGVIRTAGTNFVGLRPDNTNDLLLVDLSSVKSVVISGGDLNN